MAGPGEVATAADAGGQKGVGPAASGAGASGLASAPGAAAVVPLGSGSLAADVANASLCAEVKQMYVAINKQRLKEVIKLTAKWERNQTLWARPLVRLAAARGATFRAVMALTGPTDYEQRPVVEARLGEAVEADGSSGLLVMFDLVEAAYGTSVVLLGPLTKSTPEHRMLMTAKLQTLFVKAVRSHALLATAAGAPALDATAAAAAGADFIAAALAAARDRAPFVTDPLLEWTPEEKQFSRSSTMAPRLPWLSLTEPMLPWERSWEETTRVGRLRVLSDIAFKILVFVRSSWGALDPAWAASGDGAFLIRSTLTMQAGDPPGRARQLAAAGPARPAVALQPPVDAEPRDGQAAIAGGQAAARSSAGMAGPCEAAAAADTSGPKGKGMGPVASGAGTSGLASAPGAAHVARRGSSYLKIDVADSALCAEVKQMYVAINKQRLKEVIKLTAKWEREPVLWARPLVRLAAARGAMFQSEVATDSADQMDLRQAILTHMAQAAVADTSSTLLPLFHVLEDSIYVGRLLKGLARMTGAVAGDAAALLAVLNGNLGNLFNVVFFTQSLLASAAAVPVPDAAAAAGAGADAIAKTLAGARARAPFVADPLSEWSPDEKLFMLSKLGPKLPWLSSNPLVAWERSWTATTREDRLAPLADVALEILDFVTRMRGAQEPTWAASPECAFAKRYIGELRAHPADVPGRAGVPTATAAAAAPALLPAKAKPRADRAPAAASQAAAGPSVAVAVTGEAATAANAGGPKGKGTGASGVGGGGPASAPDAAAAPSNLTVAEAEALQAATSARDRFYAQMNAPLTSDAAERYDEALRQAPEAASKGIASAKAVSAMANEMRKEAEAARADAVAAAAAAEAAEARAAIAERAALAAEARAAAAAAEAVAAADALQVASRDAASATAERALAQVTQLRNEALLAADRAPAGTEIRAWADAIRSGDRGREREKDKEKPKPKQTEEEEGEEGEGAAAADAHAASPSAVQAEGSPTQSRPVCGACGGGPAAGSKLRSCARCRAIKYCSSGCQHSHWAAHRPECHARPAP